MAQRSVESEVKLEAGVGFVLPDLTGEAGITASPRAERRLTASYVDTPDLRLMRSGVTLRHRHEVESGSPVVSEWTLKLPLAPDGAMVVRREMRWSGSVEEMPADVDALVIGWRRSVPLEVVARLVTVRQRIMLCDSGGRQLIELDDDVVSVMEGPRLAARFRELELEVAGSAGRRLVEEVVERLERAGAHRGDDRAKVVKALGAPASAPPDVVALPLSRQATMTEIVRSALADGYLRIVDHHAGIHLDEDIEDVHQARVATRRLRSDLRLLRRSMDRDWVRAARRELGWLAGALGAVRDADVLTDRLRASGALLSDDDGPAVEALLATLRAERVVAREALVASMCSPRYAALLDRLAAAVADPPMAPRREPAVADATAPPVVEEAEPSPAGAPAPGGCAVRAPGDLRARKVLPAAVARPMRHLAGAVRALGEAPSDDALHQVRLFAKRLRYGCETATPVCGKEAKSMGRAAADLQAVLGNLHDAVVAATWLRRVGSGASAAVALAAGQLIALEEAQADLLRSSWRRAWRPVSRKKAVAWLEG